MDLDEEKLKRYMQESGLLGKNEEMTIDAASAKRLLQSNDLKVAKGIIEELASQLDFHPSLAPRLEKMAEEVIKHPYWLNRMISARKKPDTRARGLILALFDSKYVTMPKRMHEGYIQTKPILDSLAKGPTGTVSKAKRGAGRIIESIGKTINFPEPSPRPTDLEKEQKVFWDTLIKIKDMVKETESSSIFGDPDRVILRMYEHGKEIIESPVYQKILQEFPESPQLRCAMLAYHISQDHFDVKLHGNDMRSLSVYDPGGMRKRKFNEIFESSPGPERKVMR